MKFISWNVNGLRAIMNKGFGEVFAGFNADFVCLQETKLQEHQFEVQFEGYKSYCSYADRKGYSGTAIFAREEPLSVRNIIGVDRHDHEGRVVALEYDKFFLVDLYTPNSQDHLARLDYRMDWENEFLAFIKNLDAEKPVIICGDFNVAHEEIDLARPKANHFNPGFTDQERECFSRLLANGFVDSFRYMHPDTRDAYSWWSFRGRARENNVGWRIDYFVVSERIASLISAAEIFPEVTGSDHCPVSLEIDL